MNKRTIVYRLAIFPPGEENAILIEAETSFPAYARGDLFELQHVAGFGGGSVHGRVGQVLHRVHAVSEDVFTTMTEVHLEHSDWYETGRVI